MSVLIAIPVKREKEIAAAVRTLWNNRSHRAYFMTVPDRPRFTKESSTAVLNIVNKLAEADMGFFQTFIECYIKYPFKKLSAEKYRSDNFLSEMFDIFDNKLLINKLSGIGIPEKHFKTLKGLLMEVVETILSAATVEEAIQVTLDMVGDFNKLFTVDQAMPTVVKAELAWDVVASANPKAVDPKVFDALIGLITSERQWALIAEPTPTVH